jgi:tetratricopeptide (TPR) repeat protein
MNKIGLLSAIGLLPLSALAAFVVLILVTAHANPSAAASLEDTADVATTLAAARALIDSGKVAEAVSRLRALERSGDPTVALVLGVAYYHADDHVHAIETLSAVVSKLPSGSVERREAVQVLGLSRYLAGQIAEAIPLLEETREWAADNLELSQVLGIAYLQTRQPAKARDSLARTFGVPTDSAAAHLLAAQLMLRAEQLEMAEAELKEARQQDAKLPQVHYLLGQLAIFRARLDEGIELTRREIDINPGNAMAYSQLGDAYTRQQKWPEAISALQRSIWINPYFSGPYILLGKAYMKKGQPATAEGMLRRAIVYDPNNRQAHYLLGQLLQQAGREDEARQELALAERLQDQPGR